MEMRLFYKPVKTYTVQNLVGSKEGKKSERATAIIHK
jgi:hypothetical protein